LEIDVIIVGAGLSGLVAGRELSAAGKRVLLLDKGKSSGGRLATRRIGDGLADHGAQFFTARTSAFQAEVDAWVQAGHVYVWGHGWSDGSLKRTVNDGHPRYAAHGGMNQIAKVLQEGLDVRTEMTVGTIHYGAHGWHIMANNGANEFASRALILTPPVPQALELTKGIPLADIDRDALKRVEYGPCIAGMFVVEGDVDLPEPGAIQNFTQPVYWIADNKQKGISPNERIVTMHVESRFSRSHYDDPDEQLLAFLQDELKKHLKNGAVIKEAQLKKWRYSVPLTTYHRDTLLATGLPLAFAGDAFGGRGRVEGAYLSGLAAAQAILDTLD
jgi:predicted NAD/FAD-dependent oxidoreductase